MKNVIYLIFLGGCWLITCPSLAQEKFDVCTHSKHDFVDWAGGVAMGTSATAAVAGNSYVLIITQSTVAVASAPAIAPIAAGTALTLASAYAALKVGCNIDHITDASRAIRDAWVNAAATGMEKTPTILAPPRRKTADFLCWITGNC